MNEQKYSLVKPFDQCNPDIAYVCGEYFVCCKECPYDVLGGCPPFFHASVELTISEWNSHFKNTAFHRLFG